MIEGEHGPDDLYHKYTVVKNSTGGELDQNIEFIFVLRPETNDKAALAALDTYANVCEATYPGLAGQIRTKVASIRARYPGGNPAARENGK